jgi:multimeric flavodoxin WrbA
MYDPLIEQIVQDMHDAELLLIVTPCYGKFLPGGLQALLDYAEPLVQSGILRGKVALLIWAGQCANSYTVMMLEGFCLRAGIEIAGKFVIQKNRVSDIEHLQEIAHHAYLQARSRLPHARP